MRFVTRDLPVDHPQFGKAIPCAWYRDWETGKSLNKIKEREVTQKNIEEQLELLKKGIDGELALDKAIAARYGITVEELIIKRLLGQESPLILMQRACNH